MKNKNHPVLVLNGFGVSFGPRVVLDGFDLTLPLNGIDVLMGPVKSGKSTLFRTLSGFFEGHSLHRSWGEVHIAGRPLVRDNRPALVQQHSGMFDLSLLNALLQPSRLIHQRSSAEWRNAGLEWLSEHGLGEYATLADQPLSQCSALVQRCIQILAQALVKPQLLMIDEPTFGLDDKEGAWMVDWLKQLSTYCKLWVCLHNQLQARRLADRITLIGGGYVLAQQDTAQFYQRPGNEWVEQFIRTGSLAMPSPGTHAQDLADGIATPAPLSAAAQAAVQSFSKSSGFAPLPKSKVTDVFDTTGSFHSYEAGLTVVEERRSVDKRHLYTGPERRKLAELPRASRDGVELASGVGLYKFRDSNAPRGFHWIVPGKLAGCPAPGVSSPMDYDLNLLVKAGITHLITLTEKDVEQGALRRHRLTNTHLPIFDREAPTIGQTHMLLVRMQN